jgi:hypothetical protein
MDQRDGVADPVEPDGEEVGLEVEGVAWVVRVLGRSRRGHVTAPTDLLLLGFSRGEATDAELECLVVGRTLSAFTEGQLEAAFQDAGPPPDPDRPRTLFAGASERRSRKG